MKNQPHSRQQTDKEDGSIANNIGTDPERSFNA
jgi:hypothetical protein